MTDKPRNLTTEETAALARFAKAEGRSWKHQLAAVYWYNARPWRGTGSEPNDGGILHGLRNDPRWGHHGLDLVRLPRDSNVIVAPDYDTALDQVNLGPPKQIDIKTSSFRLLHLTPGHCTYGVWINGGKCGDLVVRAEERMAFQGRMAAAGFRFMD